MIELTDEQAHSVSWRGNTVAHIYDRKDAYAQTINRLHHVMKKHGLHPGRTDDDILDILDRHLSGTGGA